MRLQRFVSIHATDAESAFHSIKQRNPNVHSFVLEKSDALNWQTKTALFHLPNSTITSSVLSGYAVSGGTFQRLRISVPISKPYKMAYGSKTHISRPGAATLFPKHDFRTDFYGGYEGVLYDCSRSAVAQAGLAIDGSAEIESLSDGVFAATSNSLHEFRYALLHIIEMIDGSSDLIINREEFGRSCEEILILTIATSLFSAQPIDSSRSNRVLVSRATEFINAHLSESISISDVAKAAACSLHALRLAFRLERGVTIVQALKRQRLNRAHSLLLQATEGDSVTSIAFACGFSHLGQFGRDYRSAYGERPSETLNRVLRRLR